MSRRAGHVVIVTSTVFVVYFSVWLLVTPFLDKDLAVQSLFPDKTYAFLIAASILLFIVFVATGVIGVAMLRHSDEALAREGDPRKLAEWKLVDQSGSKNRDTFKSR